MVAATVPPITTTTNSAPAPGGVNWGSRARKNSPVFGLVRQHTSPAANADRALGPEGSRRSGAAVTVDPAVRARPTVIGTAAAGAGAWAVIAR